MDNHRVKLKGLLLKGAEVGWAVVSFAPTLSCPLEL